MSRPDKIREPLLYISATCSDNQAEGDWLLQQYNVFLTKLPELKYSDVVSISRVGDLEEETALEHIQEDNEWRYGSYEEYIGLSPNGYTYKYMWFYCE